MAAWLLLIDHTSGSLRLRSKSPCINAGDNASVTAHRHGNPLIFSGTVDIEGYEFNPYRFEPTVQMDADGFRFTVRGEPGRNVRIERSRDLVHWEYAGEVPIPASGQTLIHPVATTESKLFYRAVRVP